MVLWLFLNSDLALSWLFIRPIWWSKYHVLACFFDAAEEDQTIEGLDGLLRTHKSNYTRFFEELRKYACDIMWYNLPKRNESD